MFADAKINRKCDFITQCGLRALFRSMICAISDINFKNDEKIKIKVESDMLNWQTSKRCLAFKNLNKSRRRFSPIPIALDNLGKINSFRLTNLRFSHSNPAYI